jgi:hypothetical protein
MLHLFGSKQKPRAGYFFVKFEYFLELKDGYSERIIPN